MNGYLIPSLPSVWESIRSSRSKRSIATLRSSRLTPHSGLNFNIRFKDRQKDDTSTFREFSKLRNEGDLLKAEQLRDSLKCDGRNGQGPLGLFVALEDTVM
jgi:hypothetical protein